MIDPTITAYFLRVKLFILLSGILIISFFFFRSRKQLFTLRTGIPFLMVSASFLFSLYILLQSHTTSLSVTSDRPTDFDFLTITNQEYLDHLSSVEFAPTSITFSEHRAGDYNQYTRTIRIKLNEAKYSVWFHELGHHLWYYLLTDDERAEWLRMDASYHSQYASGNRTSDLFPDEYAMKNSGEDFAESFSFLVAFPTENNHLSQDRVRFLTSVIRRISPNCAWNDPGVCVWRTKSHS
jgi:hypothetical protein